MSDNGFYFYTEYADKFKRLTDAQLGQLIRYLLEYKATGEEPEIEDMAVGLAFDIVKVDIDKQAERYQKKAEAGRKGGSSEKQAEAEESNSKQTEATESKLKQTEANGSNAKQTEADESNEKQTEANRSIEKKRKEKEKKNKNIYYPPIVPPTDYAEMPLEQLLGGDVKLANAARDWIRYKQARGDPVTDSVFKSIMSEIGHRASIYGVDEACKTIAHSIASTYKGIAWDERKLSKAQAALNEVDTWV